MKKSRMDLSIAKLSLNRDDSVLRSQGILARTGQLKRVSNGIYAKKKKKKKIQQKIEIIIRETLENYGCSEVSMSILQGQEAWESSGRWESYTASGQMLKTESKTGTYALAPTAEEMAVLFVKDDLKSYKNLPVTIFQIGSKFRDEIRVRGGLLRSKEFTMMDAYSFSASHEDMEKEYDNMKSAYLEIFRKLHLDVIAVKALNGDMGGKVSEEFMFICDSGEDSVLVNSDRTVAFNKEILDMENSHETLSSYGITDISSLKEVRCIELGHIFQLGQRYTEAMDAKFIDFSGKEIAYHMGCYGIGVSRTLAAICENSLDEKGNFVFSDGLSPFDFGIVYKKDKEDQAFKLYDSLIESGASCIIDDRWNTKLSLGYKIKDMESNGVSNLIVVGDKFCDDSIVMEHRYTSESIIFHSLEELLFFFCNR